jgi:hypothetical protein
VADDNPLTEDADDEVRDDEIGLADDEIGLADDETGSADDGCTLITPELMAGCEPDEPRDETDSDDNDETGFADDPGPADDTGTMDGRPIAAADDAEERDETLPGYPVSMFNLRFNRIFSFNLKTTPTDPTHDILPGRPRFSMGSPLRIEYSGPSQSSLSRSM